MSTTQIVVDTHASASVTDVAVTYTAPTLT